MLENFAKWSTGDGETYINFFPKHFRKMIPMAVSLFWIFAGSSRRDCRMLSQRAANAERGSPFLREGFAPTLRQMHVGK